MQEQNFKNDQSPFSDQRVVLNELPVQPDSNTSDQLLSITPMIELNMGMLDEVEFTVAPAGHSSGITTADQVFEIFLDKIIFTDMFYANPMNENIQRKDYQLHLSLLNTEPLRSTIINSYKERKFNHRFFICGLYYDSDVSKPRPMDEIIQLAPFWFQGKECPSCNGLDLIGHVCDFSLGDDKFQICAYPRGGWSIPPLRNFSLVDLTYMKRILIFPKGPKFHLADAELDDHNMTQIQDQKLLNTFVFRHGRVNGHNHYHGITRTMVQWVIKKYDIVTVPPILHLIAGHISTFTRFAAQNKFSRDTLFDIPYPPHYILKELETYNIPYVREAKLLYAYLLLITGSRCFYKIDEYDLQTTGGMYHFMMYELPNLKILKHYIRLGYGGLHIVHNVPKFIARPSNCVDVGYVRANPITYKNSCNIIKDYLRTNITSESKYILEIGSGRGSAYHTYKNLDVKVDIVDVAFDDYIVDTDNIHKIKMSIIDYINICKSKEDFIRYDAVVCFDSAELITYNSGKQWLTDIVSLSNLFYYVIGMPDEFITSRGENMREINLGRNHYKESVLTIDDLVTNVCLVSTKPLGYFLLDAISSNPNYVRRKVPFTLDKKLLNAKTFVIMDYSIKDGLYHL